MWIQDEWEIQDRLVAECPKDGDLVEELRALSFEPAQAPWQLAMEDAQLELA